MKIYLENLTIGYRVSKGKVEIQKNISTSLKSGEFTCLLGQNGAGKTTLLRTLSGLLPLLDGDIRIDDKSILEYTPTELAKKISIVLTERPSVSTMTVEQLVALGRSPYTGFWGRLSDTDNKKVTEALKSTDTLRYKERFVSSLSDGECQRVMIAKALAQETPAIFLDEPTAFLDYPGKAEMMMLLRKLAHEKDKIIFLSTHDVNMALALADSLWLVERRRGVVSGTPDELADKGLLQNFIIRKGIGFDRERMEFYIDKDGKNCIK